MSSDLPLILVCGHSFVNRLCAGLERGLQRRAHGDLILQAVHVLSCFVRAAALSQNLVSRSPCSFSLTPRYSYTRNWY